MDRAVTDSEERERDQNIHKSIKKEQNYEQYEITGIRKRAPAKFERSERSDLKLSLGPKTRHTNDTTF